ncbi:MAG: hypothetical protein Q9180_001868 [Flavoplaca navasiana]
MLKTMGWYGEDDTVDWKPCQDVCVSGSPDESGQGRANDHHNGDPSKVNTSFARFGLVVCKTDNLTHVPHKKTPSTSICVWSGSIPAARDRSACSMEARCQSRMLEAGKSWHQMARVVKNEDEWQYVGQCGVPNRDV